MCMGKHHTSVCLGPTPQAYDLQATTPPSDPNHRPQTPKGESHSQVHAFLVPINLANVPTNSTVAKSHSWKLSQQILHYDNPPCAATVLFDEREQRSFMIQKVACYRQCCCRSISEQVPSTDPTLSPRILNLAHPVTSNESLNAMSLLIGSDHYWELESARVQYQSTSCWRRI